jgi:hypothetical protein
MLTSYHLIPARFCAIAVGLARAFSTVSQEVIILWIPQFGQ